MIGMQDSQPTYGGISGHCWVHGSIFLPRTTPNWTGNSERMHRTIEQVLHSQLIGALQSEWELQLQHVELAINSTVARSMGKTPFEMLYGENIRLPIDLVLGSPVQVRSAEEVAHKVVDIVREARDSWAKA